jgi:hypothetical protein
LCTKSLLEDRAGAVTFNDLPVASAVTAPRSSAIRSLKPA